MASHDNPRAIRADHLVGIRHQEGDHYTEDGKNKDSDLCIDDDQ